MFVYVAFVLTTCGLFSRFWIEISGQSAKEMANQLVQNRMIIQGYRANDKSMKDYLNRYIPVAATFGGICIGFLTILADFLGAIGSGKIFFHSNFN